jgi:hypothetical protein
MKRNLSATECILLLSRFRYRQVLVCAEVNNDIVLLLQMNGDV